MGTSGYRWKGRAAAVVAAACIAGTGLSVAVTPALADPDGAAVEAADQTRMISNMRWTVTGPDTATASWDAVDGALFYDIRILKNGVQVDDEKTQGTSFDFTVTDPGAYTFAVGVAQSAGGSSSGITQARDKLLTVSLDPNNGEAVEPVAMLVEEGGRLRDRPVDPSWGANEFKGWTASPVSGALVAPYDFTGWGAQIMAPVTLTAQWRLAAPASVTWNAAHDGVGWDHVDGASGYHVVEAAGANAPDTTVFDTDVAAGVSSVGVDAPADPGTYVVTVEALGGMGVAPSAATASAALHSVAFDAAGGSPTPAMEFVEAGQAASRPVDPVRDGYGLDGWFAPGATAAYDFATPVTAPTTLTARWSPLPCSVRLELNGGTLDGPDVTSYTPGTSVALPSATHVGCTFGGWYEAADFSGSPVTRIDATATGDKVFYARWVPDTYLVYLDPEGGRILDRRLTHYTYGTGLVLPQMVTRAGYTFEGWYATEDFTGSPVERIAPDATGDKSFYALWRANDYGIVYEADGGELPEGAPDGYVYGEGCELPVPTKAGHTFEGWYETADLSGDPVTEVGADATGDKTFYARWSEDPADVPGGDASGGGTSGGAVSGGDHGAGGSGGAVSGGDGSGEAVDKGPGAGSDGGGAAAGADASAVDGRAKVVPVGERRDAAVGLVAETGDFQRGGGVLLSIAAAVAAAATALAARLHRRA
ncbi:InlB B-repeat-containing protein [Caniella muris]|uniref:InlB B-repeat-containing protein n=1 Tax=Caniella muris TaxID=2941502 RepID=UPI00203EBF61|nr:InlB B-repeat-containing protein [Caniella muris]